MNGNYISVEDIPVKTTVQDLYNDESMKSWNRFILEPIIAGHDYDFYVLKDNLTVTSDSLDLIDSGKLVTKFTLTGLKRKNSSQRDFVGEIACYLDLLGKPFLFIVDRTNSDHPTVKFLYKNDIDFSKYMNNHEVEKRVKGLIINNENL